MSKSEDSKKTPDFSSFMVRKFDLIFMYMDQGLYSRALRAIRTLIIFLDSPIKKKLEPQTMKIDEIFNTGAQMGGMTRNMRVRNQTGTINEQASRVLLPILDDVMDAIHEAGYFGWEKTGTWTNLSQGKKSGADPNRPGIPRLAKQGTV